MRGRLTLLLGVSLLVVGCPKRPAAPSPSPADTRTVTGTPEASGTPTSTPARTEARATPSPSAPAAPSASAAKPSSQSASPNEGLAGLWWGRRISLELTQKGSGFAGTLRLRARSFSIEVTRGPQGWGGVLGQGERRAEFTLTRESGGLVLVADGRSYRLERVEVGLGWVGTYKGPRETILKVDVGSQGYTGSLRLDGVVYVLTGQEAEGGYLGSLRDPLTGKQLTWRASEVDDESFLFTIRLEDQEGDGRASFHALRFERAD